MASEPLQVAPTREFAIADLRDSEYNFNAMEDEEFRGLGRSVQEFGVCEYPVVNVSEKDERYGVIVGGKHRVDLCREAGQVNLVCIVVDLPLVKERELCLRLNKHRGKPQAELVRAYFPNMDELATVGYGEADFNEWDMLGADAAGDLEAAVAAIPTIPPPAAAPAAASAAPIFTPTVPSAVEAPGNVSTSDVAGASTRLGERFSGSPSRPSRETACPHCGKTFSLIESSSLQ